MQPCARINSRTSEAFLLVHLELRIVSSGDATDKRAVALPSADVLAVVDASKEDVLCIEPASLVSRLV